MNADDWKPIETMPYATRVLLWFVTIPLDGHKAPDGVVMGEKYLVEPDKFWDGHCSRPLAWVTHWMPAPPGPK